MDAAAGLLQAQKTIVIHPGSMNLRIGRASDLYPVKILHAVGRRRRDQQKDALKSSHRDALVPPLQQEIFAEFDEQRLQVSHAIQTQVVPQRDERSVKRLRIATPPQQIATFNRRSMPEEVVLTTEDKEKGNQLQSPVKKTEETLFDKRLLALDAKNALDYNVNFPMRRGELNLHGGTGGSLSAVLADMEAIWLYALSERMGIKQKDLPYYNVVLVISDIFNRSHLRELTALLLQRLQFRACFLLQDHVAALFGAGLGYACIVDVGDQKSSVSCVEDGISQVPTRVRLGYGGGDVTQVFYTLLRKCCFPYKECDLRSSYADGALLTQLKERYCHINMEVFGAQERTFDILKNNKHLRYTLQLGDECIVAPLALFYTELLNITGKSKEARVQLASSVQPDAEDCFDAEYIRETGRRNGRDQLLEGVMPLTGDTAEDEIEPFELVEKENNQKPTDKEELIYMANGQILSLDQAIVRSIERCTTEDLKRKMYSCILVVGDGIKFPGFCKWLEQKITLQLASMAGGRAQTTLPFEVNVYKKDMDAGIIAWKGASIMSCLESSVELWISRPEWEKYGLRILREKAVFNW